MSRGGLDGLSTPLVVCAGGMCSTLLLVRHLVFAPGSSKVSVGFLLVSLYLLGPEFALTAHARSYFWSQTVSLYFVAQGEVCPGASIARKGPRSQPV